MKMVNWAAKFVGVENPNGREMEYELLRGTLMKFQSAVGKMYAILRRDE